MEEIRNGEEHEGVRYLRLVGLEEVADRDITTKSGDVIKARDFLEICRDDAQPLLDKFAAMSSDHPQYELMRNALRSAIAGYIESNPSN